MQAPDFEIRSVDLRAAGDRFYAALNLLMDRLSEESRPEDPPIGHEERVAYWKNRPDFVEMESWLAIDRSGIITANASASYVKDVPENRHVLNFGIDVLPVCRRCGLGRIMLGRVVDMARRTGRHVLITYTTERVPAGEAFLTFCGAERGLEGHANQLVLAELDRAVLIRWISLAPRERFELGIWEGPYPEDQLSTVAALWGIANDAPRGRLEIEDRSITPDQLRQAERSLFAAGMQRRTLYARERATGRFAGFTETSWSPHRPETLGQGFTGVFSEFRGQGLGRWLKAEMLEQVLHVYPQVKKLRTGNADTNEQILKINHELGYKPYIASTVWRLELARAEAMSSV